MCVNTCTYIFLFCALKRPRKEITSSWHPDCSFENLSYLKKTRFQREMDNSRSERGNVVYKSATIKDN